MSAICIADFDETLLKADSTKYVIQAEKLYLVGNIFFWICLLLVATRLLPRRWQFFVRRKAKYAVLHELDRRGAQKICDKYSKALLPFLNLELIQELKRDYRAVYIVSSGWQPLIESVLLKAGLTGMAVVATKLTERFADFQTCWYTNKVSAVQKLGLKDFDLLTDSQDDKPLMALASKITFVK